MANQNGSKSVDDLRVQEISEHFATVRDRIAAAARRAGRAPEGITLVAASKTWEAETVAAAYDAGLRVFGENRVEEAVPKAAAVAKLLAARSDGSDVAGLPSWHMIGHLQSRKAREVLPWAELVHSVDSLKLARRLDEAASSAGLTLPILLEVNVSGEASKFGLLPAEVPAITEAIACLPALHLRGLMTMAPMVQAPEQARPVFRALRGLRDQLAERYPHVDWRDLSMGMTDDFEIAIEEGATIVRIGRAIFGERHCALRQI